jgi:PEP-CTERM motif
MLLWITRTFALSTLAFCGLAKGSLIYDFNISASGGIDAFSFSFTVPNFVGEGESPAFTPFTITDGTHTWTMMNDLTGLTSGVPVGCFMFDNGGTSSLQPPCGIGVVAPPDGALDLTLDGSLPLPTATGLYSLSGSGLFDFAGAQGTLETAPVGTLDITGAPVPEPRSSIGLFGIAVAAVVWKRRKRLA